MITTGYHDNRTISLSGAYWGCCKPSCAWPGKIPGGGSAKSCAKNGVTAVNPNDVSVCDSGTAHMCTNQQPWNVSSTLSYAFAGANVIVSLFFIETTWLALSFYVQGLNESRWCCSCYSLLISSGLAMGKEIIVQIVNTAYVAYNLFTLQVPSSGWFGTLNGCASQFNSSYSWGQQNGGVSNRSECAYLPPALQSGCYWRFDWFMNSNNPPLRFKAVPCPAVLTAITGCNQSSIP